MPDISAPYGKMFQKKREERNSGLAVYSARVPTRLRLLHPPVIVLPPTLFSNLNDNVQASDEEEVPRIRAAETKLPECR